MNKRVNFKSRTGSEVMKEILSLNDKKAIGHDKIPALFLKIGRHVIAAYFKLFLQFIFNNGIYPNNCKIARVVPVYKNGDRTEISNYHPISILMCFSKIIEKLIYARFINIFRKHDVIYPKQYGFQKKVSITHAMLDVVTTIHYNIYEKLFSELLLIDLRAFDTVCHQTLLIKMEHYGIWRVVNSYLHDQKQFVAQIKPILKQIKYNKAYLRIPPLVHYFSLYTLTI